MLHNAHVYHATRLFKSENPLLIIGSFLPDIAVTGIIGWEGGLHGDTETKNFSKFIKNRFPQYVDLYKGVIAHNILDDFSHKSYKRAVGYAYQNNEELVRLTKEYYEVEESFARIIAHNYIEAGVDILTRRDNPEIYEKIKKTVKLVDKDELSDLLTSYFNIEKARLSKSLKQFFDVFTKYELKVLDDWVRLFGDFEKMLSLKVINKKDRKKLVLKSLDVVRDSYKNFLHHSIENGGKRIN